MSPESVKSIRFTYNTSDSKPGRPSEAYDGLTIDEIAEAVVTDEAAVDSFSAALNEARSLPYGGRSLRGPHYDVISEKLRGYAERLTALDPRLTPEHLAYPPYMSNETYNSFTHFDRGVSSAIRAMGLSKSYNLRQWGSAIAAEQQLDVSVSFDEPAFHYQGEDLHEALALRQCFPTCFRMVYEAVTRKPITETTIWASLRKIYDDDRAVVEDEALLNVFFTEVFQRQHHIGVRVLSIIGADLDTLGKLSHKFRERRPEHQVFAIASLQSEHDPTIMHTNVLLSADDATVTCHDPGMKAKQPHRVMPRAEFQARWAAALNRAHLVLTAPQD